jgi:hypothetical protein
LIVFGRDQANKPHASWFGQAEAELATKAAALMGMAALPVGEVDEHRAIASKLPQGRVFASGRGFVPFCNGALYERLIAAGEVIGCRPPEAPSMPAQPRAKRAKAEAPASEPAATYPRPADWQKIQSGALVLASNGEGEGWFESVVVEAKDEDLFVLRWRDWPGHAQFVRRREHLALLPANMPDHATQ